MQSFDYFMVGLAVIALVVSMWPRGGLAAWRLADLCQLVQMLVLEAEQTMPGETGEEKLSWVLGQADEIGLTRFIPEQVLSAIIESTVYRIRQQSAQASMLPDPDERMMTHEETNRLMTLLDRGMG